MVGFLHISIVLKLQCVFYDSQPYSDADKYKFSRKDVTINPHTLDMNGFLGYSAYCRFQSGMIKLSAFCFEINDLVQWLFRQAFTE